MAKKAKGPKAPKAGFRPKAFVDMTPLPKRVGVVPAKRMNVYLDDVTKARARHDHRVALNAQDHLLREFARAHIRAQTVADPGLVNRFFPDLPIPRAPHP